MSINDLLRTLDLDKARAAMRLVPLLEGEYDLAAQFALRFAQTYLEKDLAEYDSCLIEWKWDNVAKGVYDLVLISPTRVKIVDLKTTKDISEPTFQKRLKHGSQTRLYLTFGVNALVYELGREHKENYPIVTLDYRCQDYEGKQILVSIPETERFWEEAKRELRGAETLFDEDEHSPGPWLQMMPGACLKYWDRDPVCPFWDDCTGNGNIPLLSQEQLVTISEHQPRSKSSIEAFFKCPERYRREHVLGGEREHTQAQDFGTAVHNGVEEIWRLAFEAKSK